MPPEYTSEECSNGGEMVKKALSTRTHLCRCGLVMDRDENAALNILAKALRLMRTGGHSGTREEEAVSALHAPNACGEIVRPHSGASFAQARRIPRL